MSQFVQTDITIGATDLLNVQRLGENIKNTTISESTKSLNRFTKQNDKSVISNHDKSKHTTTSHHRKESKSHRSRTRSRVRYESSKERKSRHDPRDYSNRHRDRHATRTRSKSRHILEERRHRRDPIDSGPERTTKRDQYGAASHRDRSKKQDVGKHQKCQEKDSVQLTIKDARDIIKMKRARESSSNDRYVI